MKITRNLSVTLFVVFLYSTAFVILYILNKNLNHNLFTYSLDDAYIHLGIAKNIFKYGTLGINPHEFILATSSILWTLINALLFFIFGISDIYPIVINFILGLFIVLSLDKILILNNLSSPKKIIIITLFVFSVPLLLMAFTGMEHLMHLFAVMTFLHFLNIYLTSENKKIERIIFYILPSILVLIRYESLFLLMPLVLLLIVKKNYLSALIILVSTFLPVILLGYFSKTNGGFFLPTSLMLKGNIENNFFELSTFFHYLKSIIRNFYYTPVLLFLMILSGLNIFNSKDKLLGSSVNIQNLLFISSVLLHLAFAQIGWIFRYEAYLIGTGIVVNVNLLNKLKIKELISSKKDIIFLINFLILIFLLVFRGVESNSIILTSGRNINEQQVNSASFIKEYYNNKTVAINDLGAVSYYTDAYIIDLWGLGNIKIAKSKLNNSFNTMFLKEILKEKVPDIVIIYESWFNGDNRLPSNFKKVGEWRIKDNIVCGDNTVSIFTNDTLNINKLKTELINHNKLVSNRISLYITEK